MLKKLLPSDFVYKPFAVVIRFKETQSSTHFKVFISKFSSSTTAHFPSHFQNHTYNKPLRVYITNRSELSGFCISSISIYIYLFYLYTIITLHMPKLVVVEEENSKRPLNGELYSVGYLHSRKTFKDLLN